MPTCCITKYKDTNLKAIHNHRQPIYENRELYYQIQRYKFESNSQPLNKGFFSNARCITKYKDTNLKAIHNNVEALGNKKGVYYQIQRYKFESNSQQIELQVFITPRCITKYKDTNLKAIHNKLSSHVFLGDVVLPNTKIQI